MVMTAEHHCGLPPVVDYWREFGSAWKCPECNKYWIITADESLDKPVRSWIEG